MSILPWIKALRAPFFTASIVPVLLGGAIAYSTTGVVRVADLLLTLIGVIALHAGTNLANDYFDHLSGNDEANRSPTPFSGGSRVIQEGLITPRGVLLYAVSWFAVGIAIGLYLNWRHAGNVILILGVIGVVSGFFYTGTPIRFGYRGVGEPLVGLNFGVLVVVGTYYVQTDSLSPAPLIGSIPVSLLILAVLWINEFPDYDADKAVNKRTIVVRIGRKKAALVYVALLVLAYLCSLVSLKPWMLILAITVPIAVKSIKTALRNFDDVAGLLPANAGTITLHLAFGVLQSLAYVLDRLV